MEITVKNLQSKFPIPQKEIIRIARSVGATLAVTQNKRAMASIAHISELSIVFVGTQRMRGVNKKYLKHDYVTDVLTFNMGESAEIIICPQVAFQNSKIYKEPLKKELLLYVIHGLLHLAGYDDHALQDIQRMRSKEKLFMSQLI